MHTFSFIFKICKNKLFLSDEELNSSLKCHLFEFHKSVFPYTFFFLPVLSLREFQANSWELSKVQFSTRSES